MTTRSTPRRASNGSRKLRDVSKEAAVHLIGRTQQRMGLLDSPEAAQKKLDAAEAELERHEGRTPEQRQKDFEVSTEKLRRLSIDGLSEQLKNKPGARRPRVEKSSLDADEMFCGARGGARFSVDRAVFGPSPAGNPRRRARGIPGST